MPFRAHPLFLALFIVLACALSAIAGDLDPFSDDFAPTMTLTENYTDSVRQVLGEVDVTYDIYQTAQLLINVKVSLKGVDISSFDETTSFHIDVGNLLFDGSLGDDPDYSPGSLSAKIPVYGFNQYDNRPDAPGETQVGQVILRWSATKLIVDVQIADAPDDWYVLSEDVAGTEDADFEDEQFLNMEFGDRGLYDRVVYFSGTSSLFSTTVTYPDSTTEEFADLQKVRLKGEIDALKPTVAVTYPAYNATVTDKPLTILGTASDDHGLYAVQVKINGGDFLDAAIGQDGTWSLPDVILRPGRSTYIVKAIDQDGNEKVLDVRPVKYSVMSNLVVSADGTGKGKVVADFFDRIKYLPGQPSPVRTTLREEGAALTVTAIPADGSLFDGWTSNHAIGRANRPRLDFDMQPNETLVAHFVINPFLPVQGTYNGLISGPTGTPGLDGFFKASVAFNGAFSATIRLGKAVVPFMGKFSNTGAFHKVVTSGSKTFDITLNLNVLTTGAQQITGTLVSGGVTSSIGSGRIVFDKRKNPAPQAGVYNVILPAAPGNTDANYPAGSGFGRVTLKKSGRARFVGKLGDGTVVASGAKISADGIWPFFCGLYGGKGSVAGAVSFDATPADTDLTGSIDWFKPAGMKFQTAFPSGFFGQTALVGSKYSAVKSVSLVFMAPTAAGQIAIEGPATSKAPALSVFQPGMLKTSNFFKITTPGSDATSCKFDPLTGLFSGSFTYSVGSKRVVVPFSGAVSPKGNVARGCFMRESASGSVTLRP